MAPISFVRDQALCEKSGHMACVDARNRNKIVPGDSSDRLEQPGLPCLDLRETMEKTGFGC